MKRNRETKDREQERYQNLKENKNYNSKEEDLQEEVEDRRYEKLCRLKNLLLDNEEEPIFQGIRNEGSKIIEEKGHLDESLRH